jgi:hypothetical protein
MHWRAVQSAGENQSAYVGRRNVSYFMFWMMDNEFGILHVHADFCILYT